MTNPKEVVSILVYAASNVFSSTRQKPPERLRNASCFSVSTSRTPPAVADTRMRCASFLFTSEVSGSVVRSIPAALNSSHVALKAVVRVSSSSGVKNGACSLKGIVDTPTHGVRRESLGSQSSGAWGLTPTIKNLSSLCCPLSSSAAAFGRVRRTIVLRTANHSRTLAKCLLLAQSGLFQRARLTSAFGGGAAIPIKPSPLLWTVFRHGRPRPLLTQVGHAPWLRVSWPPAPVGAVGY